MNSLISSARSPSIKARLAPPNPADGSFHGPWKRQRVSQPELVPDMKGHQAALPDALQIIRRAIFDHEGGEEKVGSASTPDRRRQRPGPNSVRPRRKRGSHGGECSKGMGFHM